MIKYLFPQGVDKCITFSYDDGISQDKRLIQLMDQYGLKCTFNLDSGKFGVNQPANGMPKPTTHNKIVESEIAKTYENHEVAVHTLTHPHLEFMSRDNIAYEIVQDRENLERIVGYPVTGMAFPFGTYNDTVIEEMKKAGIRYGRTVKATKTFAIPEDFLTWHPTAHHSEAEPLVEKFFNEDHKYGDNGMWRLFYIWGHSYELDGHDFWGELEGFFQKIAGRDDVWYATNGEIVDYVEACHRLRFSADKTMVINPSALFVWILTERGVVSLAPGQCEKLG